MTPREYRSVRPGARVRARTVIRNGYVALPAGALGTVFHKRNGLWVEFDACEHCRMAPRVTKIEAGALDLITDKKGDAS